MVSRLNWFLFIENTIFIYNQIGFRKKTGITLILRKIFYEFPVMPFNIIERISKPNTKYDYWNNKKRLNPEILFDKEIKNKQSQY